MTEIDALLKEDRRFPPSAAWRRDAIVNDPGVYAAPPPIPRPSGPSSPRELEWIDAVVARARVEAAAREVVRRRQAERQRQLPRSPRPRRARRNKAALIWEGEPGDRRTLTYWDLYRQVSAFANVLQVARRQARRSRRALPAADSRARDRDARVRAHRRRPQRRLRRLQRRVAARSHQRRAGGRCSSPPTAATAAARSCRSSRWPTRRSRDTPSIKHVVVVQRRPARADSRVTCRKGATTGTTA